jgi:hypothetical protein
VVLCIINKTLGLIGNRPTLGLASYGPLLWESMRPQALSTTKNPFPKVGPMLTMKAQLISQTFFFFGFLINYMKKDTIKFLMSQFKD